MSEASVEKKWLIRTGRKKILGPVSVEKIKEFIETDALSPLDEICSANGYWITVKEKDLVQKYIYENIRQDYSPVNDNKVIADIDELKKMIAGVDQATNLKDSFKAPTEDDLEYPE